MNYFNKALTWTIRIGFAIIGIMVGLVALRVCIAVAGVLLGSTLGTILLAYVVYRVLRNYKEEL